MTLDTATLPATKSAPSNVSKTERLVSLDAFRGLTIAGMILVTDPGTYSYVYQPLLHVAWNGWTPTDMIFPSFLFIVGVAMTLSFQSRTARGETHRKLTWHLIERSAILIVLGLIVNGFPFYDLHTIRIPGILQRIALCYLFGGLLYLAVSKSTRPVRRVFTISAVTTALIAGYWAILKLAPVPGFGAGRLDSLGNLGAVIDRAVFTTRHMWSYGMTPGYGTTYDPEGLLSTLGALANLLIGILAGEWLRTERPGAKKALGFAIAGLILFVAGLALNPLLPINKRIWTSTFVLFSSGFSLLALALCYWIVDLRRWRWWTAPALIFGTNAIFAFVLSSFITTLTQVIQVHTASGVVNLRDWGYEALFMPWLAPIHASLAFAIFVVLVNMAIVYPLYRKRIFLRV
jgi:predicted acyltransferase